MKKIVFIWIFFYSIVGFSAPIATVLYTINKVTVEHNGISSPLTRGASLDIGDTITTSPDAQAQIKYTNGTLVALRPNSNYKTLAYSTDTPETSLNAYLKRGGLKYKSTGKKRATIGNPIAALAILGTELTLTLPTTSNETMDVRVISGLVEVAGQTIGQGGAVSVSKDGTVVPGTLQEGIKPEGSKADSTDSTKAADGTTEDSTTSESNTDSTKPKSESSTTSTTTSSSTEQQSTAPNLPPGTADGQGGIGGGASSNGANQITGTTTASIAAATTTTLDCVVSYP